MKSTLELKAGALVEGTGEPDEVGEFGGVRVRVGVAAIRQPAAMYCAPLQAAVMKPPPTQQSQHRAPDAGQAAQSVLGPCRAWAREASRRSTLARVSGEASIVGAGQKERL